MTASKRAGEDDLALAVKRQRTDGVMVPGNGAVPRPNQLSVTHEVSQEFSILQQASLESISVFELTFCCSRTSMSERER